MNYQIMFIHGGEPYDSYQDFLKDLKEKPIWSPYYEGLKTRWKDDLAETFMHETDVLYPTMPNKYNARYIEWKIWFERHFEFINKDIILIGHSLGGLFLAKYLSENTPPFHVKSLYLVSAPFWTEVKTNNDFHGFTLQPEKLAEFEQNIEKITIIHSIDDEVVPVSHGTLYQKALISAEYMEFTDRGHILQETFPEIIESIRNT